ncbi:hypothetical protein [Cytobacillus massiliigabonensis]|uniref:hypothetical protein n=1 Tax=Cytobacillus massiliigabonensis TaxID=1871011 RepID=UPI0015E14EB1|nr:hypothetical protein [Cytobacillus massiliigabonensis]
MKNSLYTFYFIVLGIVSFFTREIVTFVMLGAILIALTNIHTTLKQILKVNQDKDK